MKSCESSFRPMAVVLFLISAVTLAALMLGGGRAKGAEPAYDIGTLASDVQTLAKAMTAMSSRIDALAVRVDNLVNAKPIATATTDTTVYTVLSRTGETLYLATDGRYYPASFWSTGACSTGSCGTASYYSGEAVFSSGGCSNGSCGGTGLFGRRGR